MSLPDSSAQIRNTPVVAPKNAPVKGDKLHSGSGCELPELPRVSWEPNKSGGWEGWHVPPGAIRRADKVYLGYLGRRVLDGWKGRPDFADLVAGWVRAKRVEKGIPLL